MHPIKLHWAKAARWATGLFTMGLITFCNSSVSFAATSPTGDYTPAGGFTLQGGGSLTGATDTIISKLLTVTVTIVMGLVVFHIYKAIAGFMAKAHIAQRREEAKSHLVWVVIMTIVAGGAMVLARLAFGIGATL